MYATPYTGGPPSSIDSIVNSLPYIDKSRTRVDCSMLLSQIPSLKPVKGTYTQNDGRSTDLLHINGTIPIMYQNNRYCRYDYHLYHRPVTSLRDTKLHLSSSLLPSPHEFLLSPLEDMMIRPSHRHVGTDGKVYLPYLAEWHRSQPRCNLVELVGILSSTFGSDPPVYKKPAEAPTVSPPYYAATMTTSSAVMTSSSIDSAASAANAAASKNATINLLTRKIIDTTQVTLEEIRDGIDEQLLVQAQLEKSSKTLDKGIASLESQKSELVKGISVVEEKTEEMAAWLKSMESEDLHINPLDILEPADPLTKQLVDQVAEAAAYEDAIYHLEGAIRAGTIPFDTFLSTVRRFSEKQFNAIALSQKIAAEQKRGGGM